MSLLEQIIWIMQGRDLTKEAREVLVLIRAEIEKVPNPYPATVRRLDAESGNMVDYINVSHERVEEFRQEVLALFEE